MAVNNGDHDYICMRLYIYEIHEKLQLSQCKLRVLLIGISASGQIKFYESHKSKINQ